MGWPILTAVLLLAILALHIFWRNKFARALQRSEVELAKTRNLRQEILNRAQTQQEILLNSMVEGLLLLDNEGRILLANRALEKLFSVDSSICGKTIIEAFRNHRLADLVDRVRRERQLLDFEFESSEIPPRWFQVNASTISEGDPAQNGTVFVFHDLTRMKQLENTRQEFVANVSHELRTPLSMIKGYVETLLDGAKDDPEVAGKFLQTIERHADRLTFLIEDLLTISRLESEQIILQRETRELQPAVQKIIQDLGSRADERNVHLHNRVPTGLSAFADFDRLEQVLWNLIDNGIKYGKTGGAVSVGAMMTDDGKLQVQVEDDGPGIPEQAKDRVFERFYRVDKARSREQGGTGLGLAIVKHVVTSHGGDVWVESKSGQGTRFFFTLPGPISDCI